MCRSNIVPTDFLRCTVVLGYCSDCVGSAIYGQQSVGSGRSPKKHNRAAWVPRKNRASKNRKSFTCEWVYLLRTQTQSM
ncbi:hypothetical protein C7B67_14520 [filamentous cyanobacterium Phorm 6]|nr:hypothetical protein C7B67_14520 [filamentous cyanobacterium Phorm 6]